MNRRYDAVVVGAGPNGLCAAIALAQRQWSVLVVEAASTVGGGSRTAELTLPGHRHDVCSAIHPLAATSPFLRTLPLERRGVRWIQPPVALAHPLDDGTAAALFRSIEETAATLGVDAAAYARLIAPLVRRWNDLSQMLLAPLTHPPAHPLLMARFGMRALWSARDLAQQRFQGDLAQALFAGCAAHSFASLDGLLTASFGLVLASAGHAVGWPMIEGGSQRLADALASYLRDLGGEIVTGFPVDALSQLPDSEALLFDTSPQQMIHIAGDQLPASYQRKLSRFRRGPGVFKIDYALGGPVPWKAEACRRAGTVHLGGTLGEIAASEEAVIQGRVPERPYVLVAQQSLFDATRAPPGGQTLWAYCHVPNGCGEDMTQRIEAQIERFAPRFRDRVLARTVRGPAELERENRNYAGGDISAGAIDGLQLFFRPNISRAPYATPNPRFFLCSASTPPGPGVHGMCGFHAAQAVLERTQRNRARMSTSSPTRSLDSP